LKRPIKPASGPARIRQWTELKLPRCYEEAIVVLRELDCVCLHNSVRHHSRDNVAEKPSSAKNSNRWGESTLEPNLCPQIPQINADLLGHNKAQKAQTQFPLRLDRGEGQGEVSTAF